MNSTRRRIGEKTGRKPISLLTERKIRNLAPASKLKEPVLERKKERREHACKLAQREKTKFFEEKKDHPPRKKEGGGMST